MRMRRLARQFLALAFALTFGLASPEATAARPDALAYLEALPSSNPYREILLRLERLPPDERKLLSAWVDHDPSAAEPGQTPPQLSPAQREFVGGLVADLRAAASQPPTEGEDWPRLPNPEDPDNPFAQLFPAVGSLRNLARLTTKAADELPPGEAIDAYAAVAQLARQQRAGGTLIEQLTGVAIEGIAHAGAARRLGEFSPEELRRLSAAWAALHPAPSDAEAVAGERDLYFRPMVERILLPGLKELLADPRAGEGDENASANDSFVRDLRLSALMDLGGGDLRIVLENTRGGGQFTLRPGVSVEGITLVEIDFERRLALIRRDKQEAVIHLATKRIVARKRAAVQLRELVGGVDLLTGSGTEDITLPKLIERARRHPEGAEGYARDLLAAYDRGLEAELARARLPKVSNGEETPPGASAEPLDPLLALTLPTIGKVARTLHNSATATTMMQAAINHRLGQLQESVDPFAHSDPWASSDSGPTPFTMESSPDGGFLLRSRYEARPGAPLTHKFAAPDAGFIRVEPKP